LIYIDEPYEFDYLVKDRVYNEERYKVFIGNELNKIKRTCVDHLMTCKDLIGDVVEEKLQAEPYNFQKVIVPIGADPSKDVHSYIYMTYVFNVYCDNYKY
jgi:hypothetical protein